MHVKEYQRSSECCLADFVSLDPLIPCSYSGIICSYNSLTFGHVLNCYFFVYLSVEKVTEGEEVQERIVKGWADRSV